MTYYQKLKDGSLNEVASIIADIMNEFSDCPSSVDSSFVWEIEQYLLKNEKEGGRDA